MKKPDKKFVEQALKEIKAGNKKSLGDAIGMPDQEDWENILKMIQVYRRQSVEKFGKDILWEAIYEAKKAHRESGNKFDQYSQRFLLTNKDSNMRHIFEFPESFVRMIELAYPTMFTNKKHFAWFAKNFKELRIAEEY